RLERPRARGVIDHELRERRRARFGAAHQQNEQHHSDRALAGGLEQLVVDDRLESDVALQVGGSAWDRASSTTATSWGRPPSATASTRSPALRASAAHVLPMQATTARAASDAASSPNSAANPRAAVPLANEIASILPARKRR